MRQLWRALALMISIMCSDQKNTEATIFFELARPLAFRALISFYFCQSNTSYKHWSGNIYVCWTSIVDCLLPWYVKSSSDNNGLFPAKFSFAMPRNGIHRSDEQYPQYDALFFRRMPPLIAVMRLAIAPDENLHIYFFAFSECVSKECKKSMHVVEAAVILHTKESYA